jgi:hypothetical protein
MTDVIHKPSDPRLGRIYRGDDRNARFPLRSAVPQGADLIDKSWNLARRKLLDQQQTPECTGYSAAHDLAAAPSEVSHVTTDLAHAIYVEARKDDEWEGEDYEGSSVLGATRGLFKIGFTGEYRWAGEGGHDPADDVALALSHIGPVVLGTDFLNNMFELKNGVMDVSGSLAGGHAYTARWITVSTRQKRLRLGPGGALRSEPLVGGPNSWGLDWGNRGEWAMWLSDLRRLLVGIYSPGEARVASEPFKRSRTEAKST